MAASILQKALNGFRSGEELSAEFAEPVLDALITEEDGSVIAEVLRAWDRKGIEANEIYAVAGILRSRMKRVASRHETFVDIVGTGGSRAKTFNVSTAVSFVVAGAGVAVAKHGNKAATSNSGSADVLTELGINPAVDPATAERCLNEIGIGFMFAPNFHRLSPTLAKVRRGLGFPTIFNCVGPLCNPASAPHQLIGVWDRSLVATMADALARLGTRRSWIVCGDGGLDEVSLSGLTAAAEVTKDGVREFEITPETFGFGITDNGDLRADGPGHSSRMIKSLLLGEPHSTAAENLVLINAAAALLLTGAAATADEASAMAAESLRTGKAHRKLEELAAAIPI